MLANTPFLILGNKIDIPRAASDGELRASLGVMEPTGKDVTHIAKDSGVRPIEIFMCSILKKSGYPDGFRWLTNFSACADPGGRRVGAWVGRGVVECGAIFFIRYSFLTTSPHPALPHPPHLTVQSEWAYVLLARFGAVPVAGVCRGLVCGRTARG
jgi:hypothetical protein